MEHTFTPNVDKMAHERFPDEHNDSPSLSMLQLAILIHDINPIHELNSSPSNRKDLICRDKSAVNGRANRRG